MAKHLLLLVLISLSSLGQTVPSGSSVEIRLRQEINSYSARPGQSVEGVVISPLLEGSDLLIPMGSLVRGYIKDVHRVGLGLLRETASLSLVFEQLQLPDGRSYSIQARLVEIENARERVDKDGKIRGIRSTNTPGYRAGGLFSSIASVDPIALMFTSVSFATVLRFSDPEIRLTAGAEMMLRLEQPVYIGNPALSEAPPPVAMGNERLELAGLIRKIPFKTTKLVGGTPSDLTNLIFVGDPEAVERAFEAAGWVQADQSTAATRYKALRSFAESQAYQEAPMSTLLLDGQRAIMNWSKTLNTFSKRHHLRIYSTGETLAGAPMLTAAATQDVGITMSVRHRLLTHRIDERIDNERAKVINDLLFTGCIEGAELFSRPWIDGEEFNGTGQLLETDRAVAVLRFNDCQSPRRYDLGEFLESGPYRGNKLVRITRQSSLILRNDILRGNLVWQGATWIAQLRRMIHPSPARQYRPQLRQTAAAHSDWPEGAWSPDLPLAGGGGMDYITRREVAPRSGGPALELDNDPPAPSVELNFQFGGSLFSRSNAGPEGIILSRLPMQGSTSGMSYAFTAGNRISPGFALGGAVTINTPGRLSHELGFNYLRGSFMLGLLRVVPSGAETPPGLVEQRAGLLTRQFSYNTIFHFRTAEKNWRPYIAAGPALQLIHLTDAPFRKARGIFRFGLENVGIIESAYNFGSAPPLEGGGIFQPALQFGGGIKARVGKHWLWRLDYRDTVSRRPDFLKKSLTNAVQDLENASDFRIDPLPSAHFRSWVCQQRLSMGFSFIF